MLTRTMVTQDIYKLFQNHWEEGEGIDIMIGIKYSRYHPKLIFRIPSGLPIYEFIVRILDDGTQLAFTCSKLTIKTLEQGLKYVQS